MLGGSDNALKNGFTLVEILVSLVIATLLMAALYQAMASQSRYNEIANERLTEPQIARVLLHQIADELRSVAPPIDPWQNPEKARKLLGFGNIDFNNPEAAAAGPRELGEDELPQREAGTRVGNVAERYALLGTSNRLIMMARRSPSEESSVERFASEQSEQANTASASEDKRRPPTRWGDLTQVFYLPRPLPNVLAAAKEGSVEVADADASTPTNPDEVQIEPYFGGVIRQEVLLPFSIEAQDEALLQLVPYLFPQDESTEPIPETATAESVSLDTEKPLPPRTTTSVLTERVTAIRFRYHDGWNWQDGWWRHDVLPRAVEISLSFDPRAADPKYLIEYFELQREAAAQAGEGQTGEAVAAPVADGEPIEKPLFPYRLVVALPLADRTPVKPVEPAVEQAEENFAPPPEQEAPIR